MKLGVMKMGFSEFMAEERTVNRWVILKVGIAGAFLGALGAYGFIMMGFVL